MLNMYEQLFKKLLIITLEYDNYKPRLKLKHFFKTTLYDSFNTELDSDSRYIN